MTHRAKSAQLKKTAGAIMMAFSLVTSLFSGFPMSALADGVTVSVLANGSSALTLATSTDTFDVTIDAPGATACQMLSPTASGQTFPATLHYDSTNSFYPAPGATVTFTVGCTDGVTSATSTATVTLSAGTTPPPSAVTADIQINGHDGTTGINNGDSYTYSWTSTGATACQMTSPTASGISNSGSVVIDTSNSFYPATSTPVTYTIACTDGVTTATSTATVQLASLGGGGGGGTLPTVDLKANGSDGPITLSSSTTPFTVTWTSANATACQMTSPTISGITPSGSAVYDPSNSFYASSSPVTFTISCTDSSLNLATDSVTVNPYSATSSAVTVDVKVNGQDGTATINNGDSYTYSWTSTGATACQMTSPTSSGVATTSAPITIDPSNSFYPAVGGTTTFTVSCTDGFTSSTDTAAVTVAAPGGGGGGGGGVVTIGGANNYPVLGIGGQQQPPVTVVTGAACLYLKDYMRADFQNDPIEVMKLQAFLKDIEGYSNVQITGSFDSATFQAVSAFQEKYRADILTPWGLPAPTGYVYILTLKKINEIYCLHAFPLNEAQANEIVAYRELVNHLGTNGIPYTQSGGTVAIPVVSTTTVATTTPVVIPIVGVTSPQGQNTTGLAAAIFSFPPTFKQAATCAYVFLLILIVLYILSSLVEDVLYKDEPENVLKRFLSKWLTFAVGLVVAIVIAYLLKDWCIILPLLIALILTLIWVLLYPKRDTLIIKAKGYLVRVKQLTA